MTSAWTGGRWKTVLRYLPLCLLAVVLWREKPWTVHLSANAPWAVAAAILLNFSVSLPLKAARWRLALVKPPPFRQVLAATIEGLLANAAIGFGSGDLVRAARLRRVACGAGSPRSRHGGATLRVPIDRPARRRLWLHLGRARRRGARARHPRLRHRAADEARQAGARPFGAGHAGIWRLARRGSLHWCRASAAGRASSARCPRACRPPHRGG